MMQTINADGIDWPLDTFIDAYRMVRSCGDWPRLASTPIAITYLRYDHVVIERVNADTINFNDVIAYCAPDFDGDIAFCDNCDEPCEGRVIAANDGYCRDCWLEQEY